MFRNDNEESRDPLGLDEAWSNETQRFEAIFTAPRGKDGHVIKEDWREGESCESEEEPCEAPAEPPAKTMVGGKHAAHAAVTETRGERRRREERERLEAMPEHIAKGVRMRKTLLIVLVLLVVVFVAIAVFAGGMMVTQNSQAVQQTTEGVASQESEGQVAKAGRTSGKTKVPNLTGMFGMTQDEAIAFLGCGATVSSTREINEEGSPVKWKVSLVLTEEPADSKSGTPTVYLDFDADGKVINSGYSAATASLGYGALSFADLVENEHIIEQTLEEAGIKVEKDSVKLPEDESEYQTFASDGTTLVRESCSFSGKGTDANGAEHSWSGVLTYDYTAANASGNLADTVRQVYMYVDTK